MNTDFIAMIFVLLGGIVIFRLARRSRKNYEDEYDKPTTKDKVRLTVCFFTILFSLSLAMYIFPITQIILWAGVVFAGLTGIPNLKPGLVKDALYSGAICCLIVGFAGVAYYGT